VAIDAAEENSEIVLQNERPDISRVRVMENVFELITNVKGGKGEPEECRLGMRIKLAGFEAVCPISRPCHSYKAFEIEVQNLAKGLEQIMSKAKDIFERPNAAEMFGIEPHMRAEEVWAILSSIGDNNVFVATFNRLDEEKRREVAEHVLTKCNVFSGKASVFSSRYNDSTVLLE
jgi:hypothetical protein